MGHIITVLSSLTGVTGGSTCKTVLFFRVGLQLHRSFFVFYGRDNTTTTTTTSVSTTTNTNTNTTTTATTNSNNEEKKMKKRKKKKLRLLSSVVSLTQQS